MTIGVRHALSATRADILHHFKTETFVLARRSASRWAWCWLRHQPAPDATLRIAAAAGDLLPGGRDSAIAQALEGVAAGASIALSSGRVIAVFLVGRSPRLTAARRARPPAVAH
jgi:hypothetical protein